MKIAVQIHALYISISSSTILIVPPNLQIQGHLHAGSGSLAYCALRFFACSAEYSFAHNFIDIFNVCPS